MNFAIISCTTTNNKTQTHISRINISKLIGESPVRRNKSKSLERSLSRSSSISRQQQQQERLVLGTSSMNCKQQQARVLSPNATTKVKRNLFGRLNHDLLKTDLNEMWKETVEKQKMKWNFDFETLRPIATTTTQQQVEAPKYEWTLATSDLPDFYKRNYRTNKFNNSLNSSATSASSADDSLTEQQQQQPIIQMRLRTTKTSKAANKSRKTIRTSSKQRTLELTQANLIITYSENRKDTLRSSTKAKSSTKANSTTTTTTEYKQPTLLEMFKQRKRRTNEPSEKTKRSLFSDKPQQQQDDTNKIRRYFHTTTTTTTTAS